MANPSTKWDRVPIFGFYFTDETTPAVGDVKFSVAQRINRTDGRRIYPEGSTTVRRIGVVSDDDAPTRDLIRAAWRAADEAAAGGAFDGAAWDAWWNVMLTGAVFGSAPASDDPDIVQQGYQITVTEALQGGSGKSYRVQPLLSDFGNTPPGINLGLVDVPPGSPSVPAPIYQKGSPGGVAALDAEGDVLNAAGEKVGAIGDVENLLEAAAADETSGFRQTLDPVLSATIAAALDELPDPGAAQAGAAAEAQVLAGLIPRRRMDTPPVYAFGKFIGRSAPTVAFGGTGYAVNDEISLTSTTGEAPTVLKVTGINGTAVLTVSVVAPGRYITAPINPVAQGSTTGAGTGATFNLSNGAAQGIKNGVLIQASDTRFRWIGPGVRTNINNGGYWGSNVDNSLHQIWEFATDSPLFEMRFVGVNSKFVISIDGQQVQADQFQTDTSGGGYLLMFGNGGQRIMRTYRIEGFNQRFGGIVIGSGDTLIAPPRVPRPLWWPLGDSYVQSVGAENPATQAVLVMGEQLGVDVLPDGLGGGGWLTASPNSPLERVNARLAVLSQAPNVVSYDLGFNSKAGNLDLIEAAIRAVDARVLQLYPTVKRITFGPATPLGATTELDALRARMMTVFADLGVPFVDVRDWVNASNAALYTQPITIENPRVHPTALGHKYLGARRAVAVRQLGFV